MKANLVGFLLWSSIPLLNLVPLAPALAQQPSRIRPTAAVATVEPATPAEREVLNLMNQLTAVSKTILREVQSPQVWIYQVQQADLLLEIAYRSKAAERDKFLRMSIQTYYGAAVGSPQNDRRALDRLNELPARIRHYFPTSDLAPHAALQAVRAEYARQPSSASAADRARASDRLAQRLVQFAEQYPAAKEAAPTLQEAAHLYESLDKKQMASQCYRLLAEMNPGTDLGRQARLAFRQMGGLTGQVVRFTAPLLYPTSSATQASFDLQDLQGNLVVLFFWSSASPGMAEGFEAMKRLADRFRGRGLEIVYASMDANPDEARTFLQGRLLTGTQVVLKDGLNGRVAERLGVVNLPEVLLLSESGTLLVPALTPAQVEAAVATHLAGGARPR